MINLLLNVRNIIYSEVMMKFMLIMLFILSSSIATRENELIIDSDMSFEEAIAGCPAPQNVIDSLVLLDVDYYSFDGKPHRGQILIHEAVKNDVKEIFELIFELKFPVGKVVPIVKYDWSDNKSMADNNSSAFCYRFIAGTKRLSNHAFGRAVDINPKLNPVIYSDGRISPKGAKYQPVKPGTFTKHSPIVKKFLQLGWRWGGNFNSLKDYHHFDKK